MNQFHIRLGAGSNARGIIHGRICSIQTFLCGIRRNGRIASFRRHIDCRFIVNEVVVGLEDGRKALVTFHIEGLNVIRKRFLRKMKNCR